MMKLDIWDEKKRKRVLQERLRDSRRSRRKQEERWHRVENALLPLISGEEGHALSGFNVGADAGSQEGDFPELGVNFMMRNIRFLQSQMSANAPTVSPKPTSQDPADRDAAHAADRVCRWALRFYELHNHHDLRNLQTLKYGSGFTKKRWNTQLGEFISGDAESGYVMEGDIEVTVPNIWDIFLDPDARSWLQVNYLFERIRVPWEEAVYRWPEKVEVLKRYRKKDGDRNVSTGETGSGMSASTPANYDVVELWEYWEKGTPSNGYQGRYTIITEAGDEIEKLRTNPETYKPIAITKEDMDTRAKEGRTPQGKAVLPYDILTDIDDENSPWGISVCDYAYPLQEHLNRLDSSILQTCDANGIPRLVIPESAEIGDDAVSAVAYDIIKYTGNIPPDILPAAPLSTVVAHLRAQLKNDIDELMGINESMYGKQSREQSGFSQSYSVNQGNMVRQRLFNKNVRCTEHLYKRVLLMAANRWSTPRLVDVLGEENVGEVRPVKGADIAHGYDVYCEYSSSLSLDPTLRKQEILTLWPILKEAGIDQRKLLPMLRLSELGNMMDMTKLPESRMKHYINRIIATRAQVEPREKEDHANMLVYAKDFVMMQAFAVLDEEVKVLIEEHMSMREQMMAQQAPQGGGMPGQPEAGPMGPEAGAAPLGPPVGLLG